MCAKIKKIIPAPKDWCKWHKVGLSLFNYQADTRSNKHKKLIYLSHICYCAQHQMWCCAQHQMWCSLSLRTFALVWRCYRFTKGICKYESKPGCGGVASSEFRKGCQNSSNVACGSKWNNIDLKKFQSVLKDLIISRRLPKFFKHCLWKQMKQYRFEEISKRTERSHHFAKTAKILQTLLVDANETI